MRLTSRSGISIFNWRIFIECGLSKSGKTWYIRFGFGHAVHSTKSKLRWWQRY